MELRSHQHKFKSGYKDKDLLCHEGGTGKTVCACLWLKDGRDSDALVVCPKKIVRKWKKALEDWGTKAFVISKEEFKKSSLREYSALVIDEADQFASPLFITKKRSQLSSKLYEQVKKYPDMPVLLLSATPVRSSPANLHSLLCFIGIYIDWKIWRNEFYELLNLRFLPRPAYFPRSNWRKNIRAYLKKYADIVLLKDCVDLPLITEEYVHVKNPKFVKLPDSKIFFDEHRHEQLLKPKEIVEIAKDFRKVLVVAYYREQVKELEEVLSKDRETFAILGGVKDQETIIEQATESDECFFIVQASIGDGFDADSFSCVIFASMSYSVRDYMQMTYRVTRGRSTHPIVYYYLLGGRCDKAVLENVKAGFDFIPSKWKE